MALSEFEYAALETIENVIRLARDRLGNVYIISNHDDKYSAPFSIVCASGEIYNSKMDVYYLSDNEKRWIASIAPFAKDLEIIQPAEGS